MIKLDDLLQRSILITLLFGGRKAFFMKQTGEKPETLEKNIPLTWNRNEKAAFCEKIQGSNSPDARFNIKSWLPAKSINHYHLYVINGELKKSESSSL